jgi:hypothetical protein
MYLIDRIANEDKPEMELVGADGNGAAIIGRVMKVWGHVRFVRDSEGNQIAGRDVAHEYMERARSGSYNQLVSLAYDYIRMTECEDEGGDYDEEMEEEDEYEEEIIEIEEIVVVEEEVNYE